MNNLSVVFYGSDLDRFNRVETENELVLNVLKGTNEAKLISTSGREFKGHVLNNTWNGDLTTMIDSRVFDQNYCQYQICIKDQKMNVTGITHRVKIQ